MYESDTWALVLAAGDSGRRYDGSLLEAALGHADVVAGSNRTSVVLDEQHREWWQASLGFLPPANVIVQPRNRGTANAILLPLLHIIEREPEANIVLLPCDRPLCPEAILAGALHKAVEQLPWRLAEIVLLGIQPEEGEPELGYIIPGSGDGKGALTVGCFIEKPPPAVAGQLIRVGALWNAFIAVSSAQGLLALFKARIPEIVRSMRMAVKRDLDSNAAAASTVKLFEQLPTIDFARDILPGQQRHLRVLPVPRSEPLVAPVVLSHCV